jgi:hypothetical protein
MPAQRNKKYAQISSYGNLIVPLDMLPKILESCYLVETNWDGNKSVISRVSPITEVSIKSGDEVTAALVQQKLSGE